MFKVMAGISFCFDINVFSPNIDSRKVPSVFKSKASKYIRNQYYVNIRILSLIVQ